ncbi:MAG: Nif3-like dinuclear metal center hexameric protein [Bacteroidales bacterium]|nr:Nif3-like dinuclear metal center hexameric protein [Bacteroidales bacterium]
METNYTSNPGQQASIQEVVAFLDAEFHPELQESYDNSGFLLGNPATACTGVLTAVDLTEEVIDEAVATGANLIATHHPFIFSGVKRITPADSTGRMIYSLIRNGISVYAAHTNLDNLPQGVNGILAERLGLTDCHILQPLADGGAVSNPSGEAGAGMVGVLSHPMTAIDFLRQTKEILGLPVVRHSDIAIPTVQRVAICGGAGNFLIGAAMKAGADIYLTGDLKYHDFQRAEGRITLADIGHFESEQYAPEIISSAISKKFSTFACSISRHGRSYVNYI